MTERSSDRAAGYKLIENGTLVAFEVVESAVDPTADGEDAVVNIGMALGEPEEGGEEGDRTEDHQWGSFGFIFCLAVLSFNDARPRGVSGVDFEPDDEFSVADLVEHLRYDRGELRFYADYVRGRCMKTTITIKPDGKATLNTVNRGVSATRWVDRLKGKKVVEAVN